MSIVFATCERRRALSFLGELYPSQKLKDTGATSRLLDIVEKDIIRIPDPMMHGKRVSPVRGDKWDESQLEMVTNICQEFHEEGDRDED